MNVIKAGVIMAVYLFIILIAYFTLSPFVYSFFDSADDWGSESADEMNTVLPNIQIAFKIFFALMGIVPCAWFIFWTFHREPEWYYPR